jgi:hypothetical protein
MVTLGRFELPTCGLGNRRSIHLSYRATPIEFTTEPRPDSACASGHFQTTLLHRITTPARMRVQEIGRRSARERRVRRTEQDGRNAASLLLGLPKKKTKPESGWNFVTEKLERLKAAGFNSLWLPPVSKAAEVTSMGYDPYDYFDFGDFDQKGGVKTYFRNRAELENLIRRAHALEIQVYADMGHQPQLRSRRAGEKNLDGEIRWTKFLPTSPPSPSTSTGRTTRTSISG